MATGKKALAGIVLDDRAEVSVLELSRSCSVRREKIIALVEEGILLPTSRSDDDYRFSGASVKRAIRAVRLQKDLHINLPGVALALDLLDEIERLRDRLGTHERGSGND